MLPVEYSSSKILLTEVGGINPILSVIILILAVVIIEAWDFRIVSVLLGILGVLLTLESILEGMIIQIIPLAIFSIIFIPVVLYFLTARTKNAEELPFISRWLSIALLIILVTISYAISFFILGSTGIEWSLISVGIFGLLSKTDLRKTVTSLAILTYSIHLLIPAFDVLIDGMLMLFSGILVLVLLILGQRIFLLKESMSTRDLRDLKY
ncbi:MAG: hypothetical protein ACFFDJ_01890 [Candidatus Odinarchaeota archaeon]